MVIQELRFGNCYCLVLLLIFTELGTCSSVMKNILYMFLKFVWNYRFYRRDKVGPKHKYWTIIKFLHKQYKLKMSLHTLKAKLKIFGLARRNVMNQNTAQKLEEVVKKELSGPSANSGYRTIRWRLVCNTEHLFHETQLCIH